MLRLRSLAGAGNRVTSSQVVSLLRRTCLSNEDCSIIWWLVAGGQARAPARRGGGSGRASAIGPGATIEDLDEPAGTDSPPPCRAGGPLRPAPVGQAVPLVPGRTGRPGEVIRGPGRGRRPASRRALRAGRPDGGGRRRRRRLVHRRVPRTRCELLPVRPRSRRTVLP